ncbi:basic proline-rich protein-like [Aquila chrysaetos chrysaetos]|uniref:basic proline-rich protein-like n=1 Tax=Aquila chrysaetos chrysaetos TaxID=223781 RepID=UPI001176A822|nr:basic proline-rich protein-like [Aquila chrysaetos chrysaetos]
MVPWVLTLLLLAGGARPGPAAAGSGPPRPPPPAPPAGSRCPPGTYPHPPPRHRPGRCPTAGNETPVVCKELRCPSPLSFPQGTLSPRRPSHPPRGRSGLRLRRRVRAAGPGPEALPARRPLERHQPRLRRRR